MTKLNITQGEYFADGTQDSVTCNNVPICSTLVDWDAGIIIADALNTYQETGKLPSELARLWQVETHVAENLQNRWVEQAEAIKELVDAAKKLVDQFGNNTTDEAFAAAELANLINKYGEASGNECVCGAWDLEISDD